MEVVVSSICKRLNIIEANITSVHQLSDFFKDPFVWYVHFHKSFCMTLMLLTFTLLTESGQEENDRSWAPVVSCLKISTDLWHKPPESCYFSGWCSDSNWTGLNALFLAWCPSLKCLHSETRRKGFDNLKNFYCRSTNSYTFVFTIEETSNLFFLFSQPSRMYTTRLSWYMELHGTVPSKYRCSNIASCSP